MANEAVEQACPAHACRDDRKSAAIAARNIRPDPGARVVQRFASAREVLRSPDMRQYGAGAKHVKLDNPEHISFFFLDGDIHRKRRAAVAGFFTPKAIVNRYHPIMHRTMDTAIAMLQAEGSYPLDELSFRMAVDVVADIVGLNESTDQENLPLRLKKMLSFNIGANLGLFGKLWRNLRSAVRAAAIIRKDLNPAVKARKREPRDDVISYMVKEGYSQKAMLMECMTYSTAGMLTTREFIVMVAWHLFTNPELMQRFLDGDEADQFCIIEEILRLEPVAALLYRRAATDIADSLEGPLPKDEVIAIDIRSANTDETVTGPCPYQLDPDRAKRMKMVGSYASFGDGSHRCPGGQLALHETRIFLDRLLRVPGIRLVTEPEIEWNNMLASYELRGAVVACDPA